MQSNFMSYNSFVILHNAVLQASYKKMLMEWCLCSKKSNTEPIRQMSLKPNRGKAASKVAV